MRLRNFLVVILSVLAPTAAQAHPHEFIDAASEVLFDAGGRITAIRHHWRFNEAFSAFALQGLDSDGDGQYSAMELEPLAQENVESLKDFGYFTFVSTGDYTAGYAAPEDYSIDLEGGRLTLHYTLPLAQPLFTQGPVLVQIYDPDYFIAFQLPSAEAIRLVDAPAGCRLQVTPAAGPDAEAAAALATIGPDQRELPAGMEDLTGGIDNSAEVNCGGPTAAVAGETADPQSAGDAVRAMAQAESGGGDLRALPAEAAAQAAAEAAPTPAAKPDAAPSPGFTARLAALQLRFNRDLTAALKSLKSDGSAFWWLGGVSFLYGIVHAAGPGHGKVVISSYLLANEARLRRGVAIAFLAALVQALVAIGIVAVLAMALDMTSRAMTGTAEALETGSFALVAGLGLYLLVRKAPLLWAATRGDAHGHHHHGHGHDCACSHHAAPAALERSGPGGAAAAVLSVGIRPCSGALVVLVFALAQGIFWAGIASTFLMALGTAITVAALAALAVGAKDVARRLTRGDDRRSGQVMLGLEVLAALFIAALGATLFLGSVQA